MRTIKHATSTVLMTGFAIAAAVKRASRAFPLDWSSRRRYRLCEPFGSGLGTYYIRWSGAHDALGEEWDRAPFDDHGVLLTPPQHFYHPTRIAQYALEQHALWHETGSTEARQAFFAQAEWLRDNQSTVSGIVGCYPFPFPWVAYGAKAGVLSAMTQGEALSVLLRAHESTADERFLSAAEAAVEPFRHGLQAGGVVYAAGPDVYLEEAAVIPPAHILNGWIFALFGLFDFNSILSDSNVRSVYERSVETLRRRLPLYDSGHWSYYSMLATKKGFRKLATLKYHAFHIAQLRVLASMTRDETFLSVAERWEQYTRSTSSKARVWLNAAAGLVPHFITRADTVPGGARSIT